MKYDRIVLDLMDRVVHLEDEVTRLKKEQGATKPKRSTRYLFQEVTYSKRRLVLAVIDEYVRLNPLMSEEELIGTFDTSIQGNLGVIRKEADVKESYYDYKKRFFTAPNEIIHTVDGNCVVCSQWGSHNILRFIDRARQLGFEITPVSAE